MIYSMTAFARRAEQGQWGEAVWELRSVNHRYLELIIRLPDSIRELETAIREHIRNNIDRGKVECFLKFQPRTGSGAKVSINKELVQDLAQAVTQIEAFFPKLAPANVMDILAWPEVMQIAEHDIDALQTALLKLFDQALQDLMANRQREGQAINIVIEERLQRILQEIDKVRQRLPQVLQNQRKKLITRFNEVKLELNSDRIEQEMVLLAQRIDVAEEIERITIHIKEAARVLKKGGAIGRRLDFLMQELAREANTLSAKSVDVETSAVAMEMKVLVEQMREQVQNLE